MCRFGDPALSPKAFRLCLLRTIGTATHETGHMFSINHCTAYECNMCGSNNLAESDRYPLYLCPECMAKVCWASQTDPLRRYERLLEDLHDLAIVAERRKEKPVSIQEMKKHLREDGLL